MYDELICYLQIAQLDNNLRVHEFYGINKAQNTDVTAVLAMARVANNLMIVILGLNS